MLRMYAELFQLEGATMEAESSLTEISKQSSVIAHQSIAARLGRDFISVGIVAFEV